MNFLESPLMAVIAILTGATVLALIRALKRDRCLMHFNAFHISLAEKDGRVTWGEVEVSNSGLEIHYPRARVSRRGFWKQSELFFKDQYDSMDGIYRSTAGLSESQIQRREEYLHRTANPGRFRRLGRQIRNWVGMIRDSVVQAVSVGIGVARKKASPGMAVLTSDQAQVSALSSEVVGHAGNVFDPILERHLFTRVIVEVNRGERVAQYCGYLADYTKQFLEIIDAEVNPADDVFESRVLAVGDDEVEGLSIAFEGESLEVSNQTETMLLLEEIRHRGEPISVGAALPVEFRASLKIGGELDKGELEVVLRTAGRVDMLVPRSHAVVRYGVSGLSADEVLSPDYS